MNQEEIVDPFLTREFATIVKLHPYQMNTDYYLHLKKNVEKKIVGKCNNIGLFTKVIKLVEYEQNVINPENFTADAEYDVKFIATICVPIVGSIVILRVNSIMFELNDYLINAGNGAITCILMTKTNSHFLSVDSGKIYMRSHEKYLEKDDYIKVLIRTKKIDPGDKKIGIIGRIIDLASEDEISKHYYDKIIVDDDERNVETIQFNEDTDYVGDTMPSVETTDKAYADI